MSARQAEPQWTPLGSLAYGSVIDGRIVAVLDRRDDAADEPGWRWVPVADPGERTHVHEAPDLAPGMDRAEIDRVHAGAREAAAKEIRAYLNRRRVAAEGGDLRLWAPDTSHPGDDLRALSCLPGADHGVGRGGTGLAVTRCDGDAPAVAPPAWPTQPCEW